MPCLQTAVAHGFWTGFACKQQEDKGLLWACIVVLQLRTTFRGLRVFINREVPLRISELCIEHTRLP